MNNRASVTIYTYTRFWLSFLSLHDLCRMHDRKASVSTQISIVGANITGLAAACVMQRSGHKVVVLEKGDGNFKSSGVVASPPNMTRVLKRWGLGPYLEKCASPVDQFHFLEGSTGTTIGVLKLYEELMEDLMAEFMLIRHGDLLSIFQDMARREGVEIRYNTPVVKLQRVPVACILEDGEYLYSDFIIGADGSSRSIARDAVLLRQIEEYSIQHMSFTVSVPFTGMQSDPELRDMCEQTDWNLWLGEEFVIYGASVRSQRTYSLCITSKVDEHSSEFRGNWTKAYPIDHFNLHVERFEPRIQKLLKLAGSFIPTSSITTPEPENLICDLDKVILMGQSAHPTPPDGMHATAMCIEDVDALDYLFTRIKNVSEIPRILSAHEELRMERCTHARDWESRKLQMLTLRPGPERAIRDAKLHALSESPDLEEKEGAFNDIWGEEVDFWNFDSITDADNWYSMYGSAIARQTTAGSNALGLEISALTLD
ncbi:hypothetical protein D9757_003969 [Collybiopsis confluens]|uniref:FAD-binding domain-containing protein n=1 Tax=Collybiopsis confluens TaxID=2823264 RepID=A0A8H5MEF3_9AGAR|nr:hypothetical protein D9757_003969 [Collybiopsis confluens]